jgi:hypothetical protein
MLEAFLLIQVDRYENSSSIVNYLRGLTESNPLEVTEVYDTGGYEWDVLTRVTYGKEGDILEFRENLLKIEHVNRVMGLKIV